MSVGPTVVDAVWRWLREQPELADDLGVTSAADLMYLGAGGRAKVVYVGDVDGERMVLKLTTSRAQAKMSELAMNQQPAGVVPIYRVVETQDAPRGLPELPAKGEEPYYEMSRWGVVEAFTVPAEELPRLGDMEAAGVQAMDLYLRYAEAEGAFMFNHPLKDPEAERWRELMEEAKSWLISACEQLDVPTAFDFHPGNWGVDPDTGELMLIDLGQCYEDV